MFPLFNRFHAVQTADPSSRQLFIRLSEERLDVILAEKAYAAAVSENALPKACVRGSSSNLSTNLLSLVLSAPSTTGAVIRNPDALVLTCVDKSLVQLVITIPVQPTSSADLLDELHHSLITAVASLEACLLATFGENEYSDPTHDIHGLQAMHAIPVHGKEPINEFSPFRRMCAVSMSLLAARAFAAAQVASKCRAEKLRQKRARIEHMKQVRKRQRELVEHARIRKAQKKRERSVFVEYKSEKDIEQQRHEQDSNPPQPDVHGNKVMGEPNEPEEPAKSTEVLGINSGKNPSSRKNQEPCHGQEHEDEGTRAHRTTEPLPSAPKRKKRKKIAKLV